MSAVMSRSTADSPSPTNHRSVDELDAAIGRLVRQMNTDSYRMLMLIRDFDDRFGWKKWSYKSCAEWLAWRAGVTLSAAREKVRTAHALRALPSISAAFAEGRLSYSKARALTRVAQSHDEDLLLAYAFNASVARVEERCRQIRNVSPDSVHHARRAWHGRSLTAWRDEARGVLRLTVELPIEDGEVILRALDCVVAAGDVTTEVDPTASESRSMAWCAQQADALVVVAKAYLGSDKAGGNGALTADHHQVVVHADAKALCGGSGHLDLPIDTIRRLLCDCSVVLVAEGVDGKSLSTSGANSARSRRRCAARFMRAIAVAPFPAVIGRAISMVITSSIGSTVARRTPPT